MNDLPDPLEAELAALRPVEPSPRLQRAVASRLRPARSGWRRVAVVAGLAAAAAVAALFLVPRDRPKPAPPGNWDPALTAYSDDVPSVWAYGRAADIDALLDRHAGHSPAPVAEPSATLTGSPTDLRLLLGEL